MEEDIEDLKILIGSIESKGPICNTRPSTRSLSHGPHVLYTCTGH